MDRLPDLLGGVALAVQRVGGDHAARQFQGAQKRGHGGDFVALVGHLDLPERQAIFRRPGAHQIAGALPRVDGSSGCLAIQGHDLAPARRQGGPQTLGPAGEGLGKERRVQGLEEPVEGVMTRWPAGQSQERAQPLLAQAGKLLHVVEALPAGQERANRDEKQLTPTVFLAARKTRIGQDAEGFQKAGGNRHAHRLYHPTPISRQSLLPTNFFFHASALAKKGGRIDCRWRRG